MRKHSESNIMIAMHLMSRFTAKGDTVIDICAGTMKVALAGLYLDRRVVSIDEDKGILTC